MSPCIVENNRTSLEQLLKFTSCVQSGKEKNGALPKPLSSWDRAKLFLPEKSREGLNQGAARRVH